MHYASADLPKSVSSIHNSVGCFWGCNWRGIDARLGQRPATSGICRDSGGASIGGGLPHLQSSISLAKSVDKVAVYF